MSLELNHLSDGNIYKFLQNCNHLLNLKSEIIPNFFQMTMKSNPKNVQKWGNFTLKNLKF